MEDYTITASNTAGSAIAVIGIFVNSPEPDFSIVSPTADLILPVYQLKIVIEASTSGDYSLYLNGTKEKDFHSDAATTFTAELKPSLADNSIDVIYTKLSGKTVTKSVDFYFGDRVSAGGAHSGFVRNLKLYTAGRNNKGQLGTGTSIGDEINVDITELSTIDEVVSISFNQNNSMAIRTDGSVWTWGANGDGQLGKGDTAELEASASDSGPRNPPAQVAGITDAVMGAYGYNHGLVLKADGSVVAFGKNDLGQLGNGATDLDSSSISTVPVDVVGLPSNIIRVIAGSKHSAALTASGEVYVWGRSYYGNLGNGVFGESTTITSTPQKVPDLTDVIQITNGRDHILALTSDGTIFSWGLSTSGQLGIGEEGLEHKASPVQVLNISNAIDVYAGGTQSFAVLKDGSVKGWGANTNGNLGIGGTLSASGIVTDTTKVYEPETGVIGLTGIASFGCGATHNFALMPDGSVYGWGWNFKGSLGNPDLPDKWSIVYPTQSILPEE